MNHSTNTLLILFGMLLGLLYITVRDLPEHSGQAWSSTEINRNFSELYGRNNDSTTPNT